MGSFSAVTYITFLAAGTSSLVSEGYKNGVKAFADRAHAVVTKRFPSSFFGSDADLAMDRSHGSQRGLQSQSLNQGNSLRRQATRLPFVRTHLCVSKALLTARFTHRCTVLAETW
jgi:hypothetical protein